MVALINQIDKTLNLLIMEIDYFDCSTQKQAIKLISKLTW